MVKLLELDILKQCCLCFFMLSLFQNLGGRSTVLFHKISLVSFLTLNPIFDLYVSNYIPTHFQKRLIHHSFSSKEVFFGQINELTFYLI